MPEQNGSGEDLLSTRDVAHQLGITVSGVGQMVARGDLRAGRIGGVLAVKRADLQAYLAEGRAAGKRAGLLAGWLTAAEAGSVIGCAASTARRLLRVGKLQGVKFGNHIAIRHDSAIAFVASGGIAAENRQRTAAAVKASRDARRRTSDSAGQGDRLCDLLSRTVELQAETLDVQRSIAAGIEKLRADFAAAWGARA